MHDLVAVKEAIIGPGNLGDQHSVHVRVASLSQVEECREIKMLMFLTELVTSEEERFFFLSGKKMYLEFYALEHFFFNLNFKSDDSGGMSN